MRTILTVLGLAILAGCASTTRPGSVGVSRPQLIAPATKGLDQQAALSYSQAVSTFMGFGHLNRDAEMYARVNAIAQRVIKQVPTFRPEASSWAWEVNVRETTEINATCMPGGKILLYSGLSSRLDLNDDEIAAVLGHEISHALREHSREKASQRLMANAIVQGIANSGTRYAGVGSAVTGVGSAIFVMLPYSREMESEADVMGLELSTRAGFDPAGAVSLQRKMTAAANAWGRSDFFNTHPAGESRIAALEAALPRVRPLAARQFVVSATPAVAQSAPVEQPLIVAEPVMFPKQSTASSQMASSSPVSATLGSVAAPSSATTKSPQVVGKSAYQVERMAKGEACINPSTSELTEKGAGFEIYKIGCGDRGDLRYRCEFGQCHREQT